MGKKPLEPEVVQTIDAVLDAIAINLQGWINEAVLAGNLPDKNTINKLALESGIGKGTIRRLLAGSKPSEGEKNAPQIDTLIRLAWHFGKPYLNLCIVSDKKARVMDSTRALMHADLSPARYKGRHARAHQAVSKD